MTETEPTSPWSDCPPGLLHNLAHQLVRQRRRQTLARVGAATTLALLAGVALGAWWYNASSGTGETPPPAVQVVQRIRCSEMPALLVQYVGHTLPAELEQPVAYHLNHCPACQHKLELLQQEQRVSHRPSRAPLLIAAQH